MMTSRERVERVLNHREPDRVPMDLGATVVTGMHVRTVYLLRQALVPVPNILAMYAAAREFGAE